MSEVTRKVRLQTGSDYTITYEIDGDERQTEARFVKKTGNGFLVFELGESELTLFPSEILSIIAKHPKRILSKVKMGKPRGLYKPTERIQNPRTGSIHHVCAEEAAIMVRTFGFVNLDKEFIEGVIPIGE